MKRLLFIAIATLMFIGISPFVLAPSQPVQALCACNQTGPGWSCIPNCIGSPPNMDCGSCDGGTRCADAEGCGNPDPCAGQTCGCGSLPACCSVSNPSGPTLVNPPNLSQDIDLPVNFTWNAPSNWGSGCPNNNRYQLYIVQKIGATCPGGGYTSYGQTTSPNMTVSNLSWGTSYCWYVRADNGGAATNSSIFEFTTTRLPQISNVRIIANKCGGVQISGRTDETDTNNPVILQMDIYDEHNNFGSGVNVFDNARAAILPVAQQNSATVNFTVLDPGLRDRVGFRASPVSGSANFSAVNSTNSPYFGAAQGSGDLTNAAGTSSLLSLRNATNIQQLDNQTMRVSWQIRFENTFITAQDNVYVAIVSRTPGGTLVSQDATGIGADALKYRRALSWKTDLIDPASTVTPPLALSADTFRVHWSSGDGATGNSGIRDLRSYCYVDIKPTTITDLTLNQNINLNITPTQYPDPANCLITTGNMGDHVYRLSDLDNFSNMYFNMWVQDGACNEATPSSRLNSPSAWLITSRGTVSAAGGYTDFDIHNVASLSGIVPNLSNDVFLSGYGAMSGNGFMVPQRQSKHNFHITNYDDKSLLPPEIADETVWFDYLYQIATSRQTFDVINNSMDVSGNMATAFAARAGEAGYKYVNGNLTLQPGTYCDFNGAIFVSGNLVINPDLRRASEYVGCVYVVKGDIVIDRGTVKTPNTFGTPSQYDIVEGSFITDGRFSTTDDQRNLGGTLFAGDGLYIRGTVYAAEVDLVRNLGIGQNAAQPAEVFDYDPVYVRLFRGIFGIRTFSLRAL